VLALSAGGLSPRMKKSRCDCHVIAIGPFEVGPN
jgi:hypothetical protein